MKRARILRLRRRRRSSDLGEATERLVLALLGLLCDVGDAVVARTKAGAR